MRVLDFNDSQTSATSPSVAFIDAGGFPVYANAAAYLSAKGTGVEYGDAFMNSTDEALYYYTTVWKTNEHELNNSAAIDPTVNDDSDDGYEVLSLWLNSSSGAMFRCTDATVGAAQWIEMSLDSALEAHMVDTSTHGVSTVAGTDASQTFINKVINADDNTITNLEHGSEVDNPSSGVHGVVGDVVGTTDAQTLSEKIINANNTSLIDIGDGTDVDIRIRANNTSVEANRPEIKFSEADDVWKYSNDGTTFSDIGSGGGGGDADAISIIKADDIVLADIDLTGQAEDPFSGGTITVGALTLSATATNLLTGDTQVISYVPGVDGQYDYFGITYDIPIGQRGRDLGFQCNYKCDASGTDADIRAIYSVVDGANAGATSVGDIDWFYNSDHNGAIFTDSVYCPTDCTQLEIGFQNTSTDTTIEFYADNLLLSQTPWVYKDLVEENVFSTRIANNGTATITSKNADFIESVTRSGLGTVDVVFKSGFFTVIPSVTATIATGGTGRDIIISAISLTGFSTIINQDGVANYDKDFHAVVQRQGSDYKEPVEHVVTPAKAGSQICRYDGYTSSDGSNNVKFKTQQYNKDDNGDDNEKFFSIDNNTYTKFTALINCRFKLTAGIQTTLRSNCDIKKFSSLGVELEHVLAGAASSTTNSTQTASPTFQMNAGDYVTVQASVTPSDLDYTLFICEATPLKATFLAGVPTQRVAYIKDRKTSGTSGGTSSSNTVHTRTVNSIEGDVSIVSLSNGTTGIDGTANQIIIPKGVYKIKARCPSRIPNRHQAFFYNVTDSGYDLEGESSYCAIATNMTNIAQVEGIISISSTKTYEVRHWISDGAATTGLGTSVDSHSSCPQTSEIYTTVKITKIK